MRGDRFYRSAISSPAPFRATPFKHRRSHSGNQLLSKTQNLQGPLRCNPFCGAGVAEGRGKLVAGATLAPPAI